MTTINGVELDDGVDEPNWEPTCDYCMGKGPLYRTHKDAQICADCLESEELDSLETHQP